MAKKIRRAIAAQTARRSDDTPGESDSNDDALVEVIVRREFLKGGRLLSSEVDDYKPDEIPFLRARVFCAPHARIGSSMFQQWNLGQDNAIATTISLSIPCYKEEVDEAYAWVDKWVTCRMQRECKNVDKILKKLPRDQP